MWRVPGYAVVRRIAAFVRDRELRTGSRKSADQQRSATWTAGDAVIALALAALAVVLRSVRLADAIFTAGGVRLQEVDPWYHLRFAEHLLANYPSWMAVDPYLIHGRMGEVPVAPGLGFLAASLAALSGGADALPAIAAWIPPAVGGVSVLVTFAILLFLRDRFAAVTGGLVLAITPGQFFARTSLGYFDHHGVEVVLSLAAIAVIVSIIRRDGRADEPGSRYAFQRLWPALVSGSLVIALYFLSWRSAIMGVGVLAIATYVTPFRDRTSRAVAAIAVICAGGAALITPFWDSTPSVRTQVPQLLMIALASAALFTASRSAWVRALSRTRLVALAALVVTVGSIAAWFLAESAVRQLLNSFRRVLVDSSTVYVSEATSLFSLDSPLFLWNEARLSWIIFVAIIPWLLRESFRRRADAEILLIVWSLLMVVAMLFQVRFAYYAEAGLALVLGLGISRLWKERRGLALAAWVGVIGFSAVAVWPRAGQYFALPVAHRAVYEELERQSPEPFDRFGYLSPYENQSDRASYSVGGWWDQGYWITAISHRVPIANPTQEGAQAAARLYLETSPARADALADDLDLGYLLVDGRLPVLPGAEVGEGTEGGFPALATWSGEPVERFYELVSYRPPGQPEQDVYVFYPDYFRTLAIRLYLYQGRAPDAPRYWVGTFADTRESEGKRRLVSYEQFDSYDAALSAEAGTGGGMERRLISLSPLVTCVPLEALGEYRLISHSGDQMTTGTNIPSLLLFERAR